MTRGKYRKNLGPCVVCGQQNSNEEYRRLTIKSLATTTKSPATQNLTIKLQVNDQLCKNHYNKLVVYNHGQSCLSQKWNTDENTPYHASGNQQKRICITQESYQELCNKTTTVEQLERKIYDLEIELSTYMAMSEDGNNR